MPVAKVEDWFRPAGDDAPMPENQGPMPEDLGGLPPMRFRLLNEADLAVAVAEVAAGGLPIALTVLCPGPGPGAYLQMETRSAAVIISVDDLRRLAGAAGPPGGEGMGVGLP